MAGPNVVRPSIGMSPTTAELPSEAGGEDIGYSRLLVLAAPCSADAVIAQTQWPFPQQEVRMEFILRVTLEELDYDEDPAEIGERFLAVLTNTEVHGVKSVDGIEVSSDAGEQSPHEKGSGVHPS